MEDIQNYSEENSCYLTAQSELIFRGKSVTDPLLLKEYVDHLKVESDRYYTSLGGVPVLVEYEDNVLTARSVEKNEDNIKLQVLNEVYLEVLAQDIYFTELDQFFLFSETKLPISLSPQAQDEFLDLCDHFDDDSYSWNSKTFSFLNMYEGTTLDWNQFYQNQDTPWDMNTPHPYLEKAIPQLKLVRSRILVLGSGKAHDAHFFASLGHIVTAVDIAPEAIAQAKARYPESTHLKYLCVDLLKNLPEDFLENFDVVFDHTLYCAIPPKQRKQLSSLWYKILRPGGHLIGIFFSTFKPEGPPFGGSESEIKLLTKKFRALYWNRIRLGPERRLGKEFFCVLEKPLERN